MRRMLIIEHEANCGPGWLGEWWREAGWELDVVAAHRDPDAVPAGVDGYDALVVLGGSMGAQTDDAAAWLPATRGLIRDVVAHDRVPFLGICLGHQLAAVALGGRIGSHVALTLGMAPVTLTDAGRADELLGPVPAGARAVHYNYDRVAEPPAGATVLATAPDGHVQALRYGPRAWGVQFHPECSPEIFAEWTVDKPADAEERRALARFDLDAVAAEARDGRQELIDAWRPMALRFADIATSKGH